MKIGSSHTPPLSSCSCPSSTSCSCPPASPIVLQLLFLSSCLPYSPSRLSMTPESVWEMTRVLVVVSR